MNEQTIFTAALERLPPERAAFLDEACGADRQVRERVEKLIALHEQAGSFLDSPAPGSPATLDQPLNERPGTQIGPYKLLQQIGEGGMGVVYMAEQSEPIARRVALKIIKPGMDTRQVIARFEAERQALAMMDHVNIARVFDAGATEQGRPYFVLELVHGVPITNYCDDNRLTPRQRLELFVPVCQAIQHAHQKGIIHRDIKPSNVMVTLYDGQPVPKVIDFGVAKATEQKLTERTLFTQYGTMVGTLEYMSPEQAEMSALGVDTRSDIYSLGVLLYELLTGNTPLSHQTMKEAAYGEILRMIKEDEPPKPSTRLSDSAEALASISANRHTEPAKLTKLMRGELDWIVMKTLEKDRGRRYETANGFAMDVQRYLNDETVQACPPSAGYRFRKFARRNKRTLATMAVLILTFLTVSGTLGWAIRDREARTKEAAKERAARRTAVEHEVNLALNEAEQWQEKANWSEALSAAKRAEGLLAGGGSDELRERVHLQRKDVEMVLRLESIRLLRSEVLENGFDYESSDRAYAKAFAEYGIDVAGLPVDEGAARLRARITVALVSAVDHWAFVRSEKDRVGRSALLALAQAADPDPWRRQVREAVNQKDEKTLAALAASPEALRQPPTSLLVLAKALRSRGLVDAEIEVLRRAQRQYPGDFWTNFYLAVELRKIGPPHSDEATSFRRAALAVRPQSSAVHNILGSDLKKQGKLDEAIAAYHKAIELDPKHTFAYNNLGLALTDQKKLDEAITAYRTAIELDPKSASAYSGLGIALWKQGKLDEAIAAHDKAIELVPKFAGNYNNLGVALRDLKKLDEAIVTFRKAIELDPKYANAYTNLGTTLRDQKKLDEAITAHRTAIELDPKHAFAYTNLGHALRDLKKLDEAITAHRTAIELDPKHANAYTNLGTTLRDQKKLDEAITAYRKAIELDPKLADAHTYLGIILCDDLRDYENAAACFRKAIELDPKSATVLYSNLGNALSGQKKLDDAIAAYRKAIELDPRVGFAYNGLAYALSRKGELDEAVAAYRTAIKLDPKDAFAYIGLAKVAWTLANHSDPKRRDFKLALEACQEAAEVAPNSEFTWQYLGWVHYRTGNWKASIEALEKSCKLQAGGTGDSGQWSVLALAHARLAAQEDLPEQEREHHQSQARHWYEQTDKSIKWRVRPDDEFGQALWDFRAQARELLSVNEK